MKYAAFIRNIMVGRAGLTRDVLIEAFERAGGEDVSSFLATGNIVFRAKSAAGVAREAARWLRNDHGLEEPIFFRSLDHLHALAAAGPFACAPADEVYEQCVSFAACSLSGIGPLPIESKRRDVCVFRVAGDDAFSITRLIDGRCGTAGPILERLSGCQVTTRNWKTVLRLLDKHAEPLTAR